MSVKTPFLPIFALASLHIERLINKTGPHYFYLSIPFVPAKAGIKRWIPHQVRDDTSCHLTSTISISYNKYVH